jgi:CRISPR/Cas system-associated exonuclease Cas4 (RecB family)
MNNVANITYRKIRQISPSQYYSIKNCSYKYLLAEAFDRKGLLPFSPNAYFGTVIHKMIEYILKHEIETEEEFEKRFSDEVIIIEDRLKKQGYDFYVPLQNNVKDFGIKKILLRKHLKTSKCLTKQISGPKFNSEKWVESKDKLIGGRIDLIIEDGSKVEIIDFKTGAIKQDTIDDSGEVLSEIKSEYRDQLKLYAYLYYDLTGKYPTQLSLVDLSKNKFNVEFTLHECKVIYDDAKHLLDEMNKSVDLAIFSANPSKNNCKYCLYRPACSFYLKTLPIEGLSIDIIGSITNVSKYQNGNITVFIKNGGNNVSIVGFEYPKYEYFYSFRDKQIKLFNLRKESTEFVYSTTKTTMIYE